MLLHWYQHKSYWKSPLLAVVVLYASLASAKEQEPPLEPEQLIEQEQQQLEQDTPQDALQDDEQNAGQAAEEGAEWPEDVLKADQRLDKLQSLESLNFSIPHVPASRLRSLAEKKRIRIKSRVALVYDLQEKEPLISKRADEVRPIASLSKLMTAMVILDADQDMNEVLTITDEDKDRILYSRSVLKFGTQLLRYDMLNLALMSSENRAANALARNFPGGKAALVKAMNKKAKQLGLTHTQFKDPAGLDPGNVSTAWELLKMMQAAEKYELIRYFTTIPHEQVTDRKRKKFLQYVNTNRLVRGARWRIDLSKTGFTNDAGNCLIMLARINERPLSIILLDSWGKLSKYGDANRIRSWLLSNERKFVERSYRSVK